jgi:hypothetical protein
VTSRVTVKFSRRILLSGIGLVGWLVGWLLAPILNTVEISSVVSQMKLANRRIDMSSLL